MLYNMPLLILTKEDYEMIGLPMNLHEKSYSKGKESTTIKQDKYYWCLDLNKVIHFSNPPQAAQDLVA